MTIKIDWCVYACRRVRCVSAIRQESAVHRHAQLLVSDRTVSGSYEAIWVVLRLGLRLVRN